MSSNLNKIELLAPAGDEEAFRAALAAGADAIYCALGSDFNARRLAANMSEESFSACVREAHLLGTKVYVTMNVVIKEGEIERALELSKRAWELGADAFIVQDFGLVSALRRTLPTARIHISTQANIHDRRAVEWLSSHMGAARVVLSRELSLDEIKELAAGDVDVECFAHGAICFCYSGLCLMSSSFGGRSANRGICAQPCRLPFELIDENGEVRLTPGGERLLCPKDLFTLDDLPELIDAGVRSLKIEGRMKAADYVYSVVSSYREALDDLMEKRMSALGHDADVRQKLKRAFNRNFTNAYLHGESGNEMMSYERSNNRGQLVGEVIAATQLEDELSVHPRSKGGARLRRHTRAELVIRLTEAVGEKDLLEIRPLSDPSQFFTCIVREDAQSGETIRVTGVRVAEAGSTVRVIRSQQALDETSYALSKKYVRKRPIAMSVPAKFDLPFKLVVQTLDGVAKAEVEGPLMELAKTKEISESDIIEHVGRMGESPFEAASWEVELDAGLGMSFSLMHKLRSQALDALEQEILESWNRHKAEDVLNNSYKHLQGNTTQSAESGELVEPATVVEPAAAVRSDSVLKPKLCVLAANSKQAELAKAAGADRIYAREDVLLEHDVSDAVIPYLSEIARTADRPQTEALLSAHAHVVAANISEVAFSQEHGVSFEIGQEIPILNSEAIRAFAREGAACVWISPELSLNEIEALAKALDKERSVELGIFAFGRQRVMTSEHCVLQALDACIKDCERCKLRTHKYMLRNIDGKLLPVQSDLRGRSRIYSAELLDISPELEALYKAGVSSFMLDGNLIDDAAFADALTKFSALIDSLKNGRSPSKVERQKGSHSGHLFAPIG